MLPTISRSPVDPTGGISRSSVPTESVSRPRGSLEEIGVGACLALTVRCSPKGEAIATRLNAGKPWQSSRRTLRALRSLEDGASMATRLIIAYSLIALMALAVAVGIWRNAYHSTRRVEARRKTKLAEHYRRRGRAAEAATLEASERDQDGRADGRP